MIGVTATDRRPDSGEATGPSAWDAALRLLGVRARSRQEMRERLARRGFGEETVDDVMARLDKHGLLDDAEFAAQWVRSRSVNSGKGRIALRHELWGKGIDQALIAATLDDVDPDAERAVAQRLVAKKLTPSLRAAARADRADREKILRRLVGMLARRGYPQSLCLSVVTEALAEEE